jgi:hypothetical protein
MPAEATYRKFGAGTADPSKALIAGQQNVADSLKSALGGVRNLFEAQEKKYTEENTLNMQQYLKKNIQDAGLGADPVDQEAIKQKFGNLIDMDKIDETVTSTKNQMIDKAVDEASGAAGAAFSESEDIATAGNVFKQNLLAAGMGEEEANRKMSSWRTDNQFLAEDIKVRDTKLVDNAVSDMFKNVKSGRGTFEEVRTNILDGMPEKLRRRADLQMRQEFEDISKMDENQRMEYETHVALMDGQVEASEEAIANGLEQLKNAHDSIETVSDAAYSIHGNLDGDLGGVFESISNDASNDLIGAAIPRGVAGAFYGDEVTGHDVGSFLQDQVENLIGQGMNRRDAAAIAVQAYQDNKVRDSEGNIGTVLKKSNLKSSIAAYASLHAEKRKALKAYSDGQAAATKKREKLLREKLKLQQTIRTGERDSNVTGKSFDSQEAYNKSTFGNMSTGFNFKPKGDEPSKKKGKAESKKSKVEIGREAVKGKVDTNRNITGNVPIPKKRTDESTEDFKKRLKQEGAIPLAAKAVSDHITQAMEDDKFPGFF